MKKILILFGHPAFRRSTINVALRAAVETLDGITFHDLYASYPDFLIDVAIEQQLCESHDIIIFQHPFYWYSTPSIVKEWFDLVLEHAWAYGSTGKALEGKITFQTLTARGEQRELLRGRTKFIHPPGVDHPFPGHGQPVPPGLAPALRRSGYSSRAAVKRSRAPRRRLPPDAYRLAGQPGRP